MPRRRVSWRGAVAIDVSLMPRGLRKGEAGRTRHTGDSGTRAARLANEVAEATLTMVDPDGSVRDISATLLLPSFVTSTQPFQPANSSATYFARSEPHRAAVGAGRKMMVMNSGAARRVSGGGNRPEAADVKEDVVQENKARKNATAPSVTVRNAATSRPTYRTMARVIGNAGVHSAPDATRRRFQSPQPTPRGVLAEVVHQPARTVGGAASAPPRQRRPRTTDGTRLKGRQPRPPGRLAAPLNLPCRGGLASDDLNPVTMARPCVTARCNLVDRGPRSAGLRLDALRPLHAAEAASVSDIGAGPDASRHHRGSKRPPPHPLSTTNWETVG